MHQVIQTQLQRFKNFLGFAKFFAKKNFVPGVMIAPFVEGLKDFFSLTKKRKMSKYRVDYQMYRLNQMEQLIAQNNSHFFITGSKIDDIR